MNYDPENDLIRGDIRPDVEMVIRPYDVIFTNTVDIELELDGEFIEIPVQWIPELIACLSEAYCRATGGEVQCYKRLSEITDAVDGVLNTFGAPGDYGYATDQGRALFKLHNVRRRATDSESQESTHD